MDRNIEQIVLNFIKDNNMISKRETVIVGVSGGADSICLLTILAKLREELEFDIVAVHVNHMLRGDEAFRDEAFVKNYCEQIGVKCVASRTNVKSIAFIRDMSIEEAGRMARYITFEKVAEQLSQDGFYRGGKVAVAHHSDDNAETVLLNLIRGSGLNGLVGMKPVSEREKLTIIRPFLCIDREDIEEYLDDNGIEYVTDSSNMQDDFARNKVRLNIMPEMNKINHKAAAHIHDTASMLAEIQKHIDIQVSNAFETLADARGDAIALNVEKLKFLDGAIRNGVVYRSIGDVAGSLKDITHRNVQDVLALMDKQTGRKVELPYGLVASRSYSNLIIRRETEEETSQRRDYESNAYHKAIDNFETITLGAVEKEKKVYETADGGRISFEIIEVTDKNRQALTAKKEYTKVFDCDKIKGALILGRPQPGDSITFAGGTKTLKKYFIDEKIPQEERRNLLVLKDMDSVLWVLGYRMGEAYKITNKTVKALKVEIIGGDDER